MTPQRIPPELLATTPPTQAISVQAGSGPSAGRARARMRLTWPSTPGLRAHAGAAVLDARRAQVAAAVEEDRRRSGTGR